jgi:AcrR family transcriptional regulator
MARTQGQRKAETRRRLIEAAVRLIAERGIDGVSVDALADEAHRTSGAVYAHFGSKDGLVTAALDEWTDAVGTVIAALLEASPDLPSRLDGWWATFVDPPDSRGDQWLLLEHELWLRAARDPAVAAPLAQRYAAARAAMAERFAEWQAAGEADLPVPPDALAVLVLGLLIGLEMQHRLDSKAVPDDTARRGLLALFGAAPATVVSRTSRKETRA